MPLNIWQSETDCTALKCLDEARFAGAFMRRQATYRKDHAETARLPDNIWRDSALRTMARALRDEGSALAHGGYLSLLDGL